MTTMRNQEARLARDLAKARDALERGKLKSALRHTWNAAHVVVRQSDEQGLEAVIAVAVLLRQRSSGRVQKDAQMVITYCSHSLGEAKAGLSRSSLLARLLRREPERRVKSCPDCAETIKAEARVCRFCGYRFDVLEDMERTKRS